MSRSLRSLFFVTCIAVFATTPCRAGVVVTLGNADLCPEVSEPWIST